MNWKKLRARIPHKVQITPKVFYEVLWGDLIHKYEDCDGVTKPDIKQIVIKQDLKPKEAVLTYLHEVAHAFSIENNIALTETQVLKIEASMYYVLKEGNIFNE